MKAMVGRGSAGVLLTIAIALVDRIWRTNGASLRDACLHQLSKEAAKIGIGEGDL